VLSASSRRTPLIAREYRDITRCVNCAALIDQIQQERATLKSFCRSSKRFLTEVFGGFAKGRDKLTQSTNPFSTSFEYCINETRLILYEYEIIFSDTGRGCFSVLVAGDPGRGGGQKAPSARLERRRPARPF
jgi:hypothetical protein